MSEKEYLSGSKYYISFGDITDKFIKDINGVSEETTPAQEILGSAKKGKIARQATPTVVKFTNLSVNLYIKSKDKQMYEWYKKCNQDGKPRSWKDLRKEGMLSAYDQDGDVQARWELINCYPCKYTGPTFNASGSEMVVEGYEIVHEGIKRVM